MSDLALKKSPPLIVGCEILGTEQGGKWAHVKQ